MQTKISILLISAAVAADNRLTNLPLSTRGSHIVDSQGNTVRLACTNWYGAHMERYVVNGLDLQDLDVLAGHIAAQGFNCIRLPYSLEQYYLDPVVEVSAVSANPSLYGLTSMQVFDKTVEALTNAGLGVVLNNHISDAMWCCSTTDGNGLWHTNNYPEDMWMEAVASMSERYVDNLLVIGNDLRNEIREDFNDGLIASWGSGNQATDWMLAAQNCANEVLQRAPNQLMIIEGLNFANNLEPVKKNPIELNVPDKLVYSFHLYPWQTHVTSFDNWEDFSAGIYKKFGFILEENNAYTAPLFVGEFGQAHQDNYWDFLMRWLTENPQVGWAQWSWNGYKTTPDTNESYGIMKSDMCTVRHEWLLSDLSAIMDAPSPQTNIFEFDTLQ